MSERDHQIRERAYLLWERAGRPHGVGDEFWHQAAAEIAGEAAGKPSNGLAAESVPSKGAKAKSKAKGKAKDEPVPMEAPEPVITPDAKAEKSAGKKKKKRKD
jgi:prophage tail gpP-like protein